VKTKKSRPTAPAGPEASAAKQELARRQAKRRRKAALWALLFPLIFTTVIAIGLAAMYYRRMEFFRPHGLTTPHAPLHIGAAASGPAQC